MTRKIAWWLVLATVAAVAVCAQIDRASYRDPTYAFMVPGPFRSFAQPATAVVALVTGSDQAALAEARTLVRRRPLPADHLYLLAIAELRAGDRESYARAFRAATTRGWRNAPLQVAAAEAALSRGDVAGAAARIIALMAADGGQPAIPGLVARLYSLPQGPERFGALAAGMSGGPRPYLEQARTSGGAAASARASAAARSIAVDAARR